jgi:two-component system, chemotaxis family, chemotaxis protein CheY
LLVCAVVETSRRLSTSEGRIARRVLVIEDERAIRETIAAFLEESDYEVAQVGDGRDALASMRSALPDVVIVDLKLPRMNGPEFVQEMRADPRLAAVPIIILSADPGLADAAEALGARGALAKPFHLDVLLAVVDRVSQS